MLELFSDRARRILTLAQNDARARGHKSIHTCNLLIGFLIYGEGHAADILGKLGVKLDDVSSEIDRVYPRANVQTYGHIPTTSNTKKVFYEAQEFARSFQHTYIGTEHLLNACVASAYFTSAQVLMELGLSPDRLRTAVRVQLEANTYIPRL